MKQILIIVVTLLLTFNKVNAQAPAIQWQKCYGGIGEDNGAAIFPTKDGGYLFSGRALSNFGDMTCGHGGKDFWLVKTDAVGAIEWQQCYGGPNLDECVNIDTTADGGYIMIGSTLSNGGQVTDYHGDYDIWVVKTDSMGNMQWQKCLGGSKSELGWDIQQTADMGYILTGGTSSNDGDVSGLHSISGDAWVVKLDSIGNIQWQKCLGGAFTDKGNSIIALNDGTYIILGETMSNDGDVSGNHGEHDMWVVKLANNGDILWQKCYGGTKTEYGYHIIKSNINSYIIVGSTTSSNGDLLGVPGIGYAWMLKIDTSGQILWQKKYGGSSFNSIQNTIDSGYILTGIAYANNADVSGHHGMNDCWLVKTNSMGELQWQKCLGGTNEEWAYSAIQTPDGGYILTGYTGSNDGDVSGNQGDMDIWVVKLDSDALSTYNIQDIQPPITLSPNPVRDVLYLHNMPSQGRSRIYNMQGALVYDAIGNSIDVSFLPAGLYNLYTGKENILFVKE